MNSIPPGLGPSPFILFIALAVFVSAPIALLTALSFSLRPRVHIDRILFLCCFILVVDFAFNQFLLPRAGITSIFNAICGVGLVLSVVALWKSVRLEKQ
jgi:uncharacterized membrane protein